MNKDKVRQIHTGLYTKVAKEIIDSVIGQLSDGWGENSPANEKWWHFAACTQASDGEVLIEVSTESGDYDKWNSYYKFVRNGFFHMSVDEVKQKFAGWIKKTAKMEMADEKAGNQWNRGSEMKIDYLSYYENVTAADAYFVYEMLLGRDSQQKYSCSTVQKVLGKKLSDEATKANEEKAKKIKQLTYDRDQVLKQIEEKKYAAIKQLEAQYAKEYREKVELYNKQIDEIKAA